MRKQICKVMLIVNTPLCAVVEMKITVSRLSGLNLNHHFALHTKKGFALHDSQFGVYFRTNQAIYQLPLVMAG